MEYTDFYSPFVSATNTFDGETHIVYSGFGSTTYRNYNGSTWSSGLTIGDNYLNPVISSVSNDLFVVWMGPPNENDYIKYRQYDAIPLAPQNLTIGADPGDGLVRLNWTANTEEDLSNYEVFREVTEFETGWLSLGTSTSNYFVDQDMYYVPGAGQFHCYYKIRAMDINNNYSDYSSVVSARTEEMGKLAIGNKSAYSLSDKIYDYQLNNYPNPFNPRTNIIYSVKEAGLVQLKVYDLLGREIAILVNENKNPGNYSILFDGSNLPSGIYIYTIKVNDFTAVKKMAFMK